MKRFLQILALLTVALLLLASGVNATFDYLDRAPSDERIRDLVTIATGEAVFAFTGDCRRCPESFPRPARPTTGSHFPSHRVSSVAFAPEILTAGSLRGLIVIVAFRHRTPADGLAFLNLVY